MQLQQAFVAQNFLGVAGNHPVSYTHLWVHVRNTGDTLEYFFGRPFTHQSVRQFVIRALAAEGAVNRFLGFLFLVCFLLGKGCLLYTSYNNGKTLFRPISTPRSSLHRML